uniref:Uncharacterized protein n=1 Tax=Rhizophora mucronata TaxID=61149 RepID=A0A2P2K1J6_RHIMU
MHRQMTNIILNPLTKNLILLEIYKIYVTIIILNHSAFYHDHY